MVSRGRSCQFLNFLVREEEDTPPTMTRSSGEPIGNYRSMVTVGPKGPPLMENVTFLEDIQHVSRGRIPERLFHARGVGAHGYFEVTNDISKYCDAKLFKEVGKRTPIFSRLSIGGSELGSAETINRGIRGVAIKFYTEEGNWDLTALSDPVLMVNDPLKIHGSSVSARPDPRSNLPNPSRVWDFISKTPEMIHFAMWQHTDNGLPDGYRYMDSFAQNTFKLINKHGEPTFCRFHIRTDQGVRNLTPAQATQLAGQNPDYYSQDLIEAINRGDYPSYSMHIQVMTMEQAQELEFNPFNVTMLWSEKQFPLIKVGRIVLNRNTANHWDETEQAVFMPGNFVPGIRAAEGDRNLASRMLLYQDTQIYRMGVNRNQIPINRPLVPVANYQREGRGVFVSQGAAPNYFPNSFGGPVESERAAELDPSYKVCADVVRQDGEDDFYAQPRHLWQEILDEEHRKRLVNNLATSLRLAVKHVREAMLKQLGMVDERFAEMIQDALDNPDD